MGTSIMNKHLSKQDKNILRLILGIPLLFFMGFVAYTFLNKRDIVEVIQEDDLALNFTGNIDSLYIDLNNHSVQTALLSNGYKCFLPRKWLGIIKTGDSLSKKKNTFKLEVFRKGSVDFILDYRDTYKKY